MFSDVFLSDWRSRLSQPIVRGLLLSLSLHLLLLALVRPEPSGGERENLVIHARLVMPAPHAQKAITKPLPETMPQPPAQPANPAVNVPLPLLSSRVPSPAAPVPQPPAVEAPMPVVGAASVAESKPAGSAVAVTDTTPHNAASSPLSIGIDATWYLARQVDVHARAIGSIVPAYPDEARRRNQEGTLKLMLKIDDLGRVRDVEVVEADLPGVFDQAALDAFRQAHFQPAMKDGRPVRYQAYIRVMFKLRD